jgi:hypothetical protein
MYLPPGYPHINKHTYSQIILCLKFGNLEIVDFGEGQSQIPEVVSAHGAGLVVEGDGGQVDLPRL